MNKKLQIRFTKVEEGSWSIHVQDLETGYTLLHAQGKKHLVIRMLTVWLEESEE